MEITDIKIKKVAGDNKVKAYASITFDNSFVVHDVKVIQGKNGPFVAMPSRRTKNGEIKDVAHPITAQFREKIQNAVLEAYQTE